MVGTEAVSNFDNVFFRLLGIQNENIKLVTGKLTVKVHETKMYYLLPATQFELNERELTLFLDENYRGEFKIYLFNENGYVCISFFKKGSFWVIEHIVIVDKTKMGDYDKSGHTALNNVSLEDNYELTINRRHIQVLNQFHDNINSRRGYTRYNQITPLNDSYKILLASIFSGENAGFCFKVKKSTTNNNAVSIYLNSAYKINALVIV